jgi:hypothetical protein
MTFFTFFLVVLSGVLGLSFAAREALPLNFDPYATLRVQRDVSSAGIRSAYKTALNVMGRAASRHGHGQATNADDMAMLADIGLSYRVLIDAAWRGEWDAAHPLPAGAAPPTPYPVWDKEEEL